uniref:Putative RNA-directed DNA polymerase from transposon X-element n=1 Tax=Lygus hesperus TaxID=30085 RepID=A0A0A9XZ61_LYGHE
MGHNTLRIATWNANGLVQNIKELEIFLNQEKIDICLISESHLTRTSYANIKGYNMYRSVHPADRARGGSAIFIKGNIKHSEQLKIETEKMQLTTVNVKTKNRTINIAAIYCPPRYALKKDDYVNLFCEIGHNFIIGGDFNAKHEFWGSRTRNPKGVQLFTAVQETKCNFHSGGGPTYWPTDVNKVPDLLDFFIVKGVSGNYIHTEDSDGLSSDHSPVIMTLSDSVILREETPKLINKQTNWELFREKLSESINLHVPIRTPEQLEREAERLTENIQEACWSCTPINRKKPFYHSNYPLEVRELVQAKRKARKTWQRVRSTENKRKLNALCNELKALNREIEEETLAVNLHSLTAGRETEYSLYRATKGLKRPKIPIPPIKREDGYWARSAKEKADLFADTSRKHSYRFQGRLQMRMLRC